MERDIVGIFLSKLLSAQCYYGKEKDVRRIANQVELQVFLTNANKPRHNEFFVHVRLYPCNKWLPRPFYWKKRRTRTFVP